MNGKVPNKSCTLQDTGPSLLFFSFRAVSSLFLSPSKLSPCRSFDGEGSRDVFPFVPHDLLSLVCVSEILSWAVFNGPCPICSPHPGLVAVGGHPPGDSMATGSPGLAAQLPWKQGWDLQDTGPSLLFFSFRCCFISVSLSIKAFSMPKLSPGRLRVGTAPLLMTKFVFNPL